MLNNSGGVNAPAGIFNEADLLVAKSFGPGRLGAG